jgi:hypothetical protein
MTCASFPPVVRVCRSKADETEHLRVIRLDATVGSNIKFLETSKHSRAERNSVCGKVWFGVRATKKPYAACPNCGRGLGSGEKENFAYV